MEHPDRPDDVGSHLSMKPFLKYLPKRPVGQTAAALPHQVGGRRFRVGTTLKPEGFAHYFAKSFRKSRARTSCAHPEFGSSSRYRFHCCSASAVFPFDSCSRARLNTAG